MLERFTWNWAFFSLSVVLCLMSANMIRTGQIQGEIVFNMVLGVFALGFFTSVLINEKKNLTDAKKSNPVTVDSEEEKWRSYLIKKE